MNLFFGIIIGLLILMALVVAHEFGHFMMARKNGIKVNEFGICFPPRLAAWVRKEVDGKSKWVRLPKSEWKKPQDSLVLSLNLLPIGGFCSMDGESDADRRPGTFGAANFWAKTKVLFGGVLMNFLVATVLLIVLAFTGMPNFLNNQFTVKSDEHTRGGGVTVMEIMSDTPAAASELRAEDIIYTATADDKTTLISNSNVLVAFNAAHAGETVTYEVYRPDCRVSDCLNTADRPDGISDEYLCHEITVTLGSADAPYALGISMQSLGQAYTRYTWSAPIVGIGTTLQITGETFKSLGVLLWDLISGVGRLFSPVSEVREAGQAALQEAGDSVSGPVGIIGVIFPAFASTGLGNLTFLTALVSISLACMNILPIPALDGGRWLLIAIYKLRKKPLTKETEEKIVSRAFMVLLALIAVITVLDIIKLF